MSQKRTAALGTHSELGLSDFYTSWSLDWFDEDQIALSLLFESNAQTFSSDDVNYLQKTYHTSTQHDARIEVKSLPAWK